MIERLRSTYHDYPSNFWVLVGASFIDTIGSTAFRPFFALYITQRFGVGMTEAGACCLPCSPYRPSWATSWAALWRTGSAESRSWSSASSSAP